MRHHVPPDSGGSFGVKQSVLPYIIMCCLASRKSGAPVKFIEDRLEHLQAATSATSRHTHLKAAVDQSGKILALDYDQIEDCGAYLRAPEPATLYRMHGCVTGPYQIPNLKIRNRVVLINKTPTGLVRGFGGPQVYFALERLIQKIANQLGKTHQEIAALNYVQKDQFPYRAAAGALLDSGDYQKALKTLIDSPEFKKMLTRKEQLCKEGRYYGIGIASIVEPSLSNMGYITTVLSPEQRAKAGPKNGAIASATVSVDPSGSISANIASAPAGQGHQTVISQLLADIFGVSPSQIQVNVDFDTAKDGWSIAAGNYSSRFAAAVAGTVSLAANKLKGRIAEYAAHLLNATPENLRFANGQIWVAGHEEKGIPFSRVCGNFHWSPALVQKALGKNTTLALQEMQFWSPEVLEAPDEGDRVNTSAAYGFALDACGVEIDVDTCAVKIDQYITVHDAGKILNPALADGQVYGAYSQAIGAAPSNEDIQSLEVLVQKAKKPLLIVGGGAWNRDAGEKIAEFATNHSLPIISAFRRQDIVDNLHSNYCGEAGLGMNPKLSARIQASDLILCVGARLGETTTNGYTLVDIPHPKNTLVHIHADANELGKVYQASLAINSTPIAFALAVSHLKDKGGNQEHRKAWLKEARNDYLETLKPVNAISGVNLSEVMIALQKLAPKEAVISNGAGNYTLWVQRFYQYRGFRTQLAPTSGTMGYGLPAAIAAKLLDPSRPAICFAGDGCFLMTSQELATAVQYGANVIVIVVNNGTYGSIRMHQERHYPGNVWATDLNNPDFVGLARSYGAIAERIENTSDFEAAFQRALNANKPTVIELVTDKEILTPRLTVQDLRAAIS